MTPSLFQDQWHLTDLLREMNLTLLKKRPRIVCKWEGSVSEMSLLVANLYASVFCLIRWSASRKPVYLTEIRDTFHIYRPSNFRKPFIFCRIQRRIIVWIWIACLCRPRRIMNVRVNVGYLEVNSASFMNMQSQWLFTYVHFLYFCFCIWIHHQSVNVSLKLCL